ncbi:MAG: hypothetical protein QW518_02605 [Thermofilaceae archaeon]
MALPRSYAIAVTAAMSALAIVLALFRIEFPFYPLTFLKFDLAELPSVLTLALVGPKWSYLCAAMHAFGLLARGSDPLGVSMKFLAVTSMLAGLHAAKRRWRYAVAVATAARVAVMSLANFAVLGFLFPHWLTFAQRLLNAAGIPVKGWTDTLLVTLALVAVFNTLHVLLSTIPSVAIASRVQRVLGSKGQGGQ